MTAPIPGAAIEADKAAVQFQIALTKIGIWVIKQALGLWAQVPVTKVVDTQDAYIEASLRLIARNRALSRDLAVSYYRLARALRTGRTIPKPGAPAEQVVTLDELRADFQLMLDTAANPGEAPPEPSTKPPPDIIAIGIPVDPIEGIDEHGDADEVEIEREAEEQARVVLQALGPNALQKALKDIDEEQPASQVDQQREDAHKAAGSRQAAAVERLSMNGGKSAMWSIGERDSGPHGMIGWVRVSMTGTPCGWCAMLISRGAVYRSEKSAQFDADGDLYHDNCHCVAEPVFIKSQLESSRYDLNREYGKEWPRVTRGLSGKAAVSAWRKWIRQQQNKTPVQVAA